MRLASAAAKSSKNGSFLPTQLPFLVCSQAMGTYGCHWIHIQVSSPGCVSMALLLPALCSAYGGKLWLCRSQLLISQCRGWLGLHCGHHPTDQRFWRSRSEIRLFCSLLEPFCVPALVCSPSGLALEHWLWHLQLGMEIACPKTQHTRVPVLRLSPSKVNPMLFCMLLLFALA